MQLLSNQAISLLGIYSRVKKVCQHKDLSTNVYSSFIFNSQKLETAQMSIHKQTDKQIAVTSIQWNYYSAIKRHELVRDTKACTNLRIITLSERSQTKHSIGCMIPFSKLIYSDQKQISNCQEI